MQSKTYNKKSTSHEVTAKFNEEENINPDIFAINQIDAEIKNNFKEKIVVDPNLNRKIVSFQGNKKKAQYRLFKYKEAFSADLIKYLLQIQKKSDIKTVLDPFAGVGTTLFACNQLNIDSEGIELLPIGQEIIEVRKLLNSLDKDDLSRLTYWKDNRPWKQIDRKKELNQLSITEGAYPPNNKESIEKFLYLLDSENNKVKEVLFFSLISILESISYTRKDGQYLRWDKRANRKNGSKKFCKSKILEFDEAITEQIEKILLDIGLSEQKDLFEVEGCFRSGSIPNRLVEVSKVNLQNASITLKLGSCLEIMPTLKNNAYDTIITSPPYCNRYDYTRTYALELALLGITHKKLIQLRQDMLSCTVENKAKPIIENWQSAIDAANREKLLQLILNFLESESEVGRLNNKGIPRMVKGYFYEMSCVIAECFRVLSPGGYMFMVNDNVRYAGINISVDLILSNIAEKLGFTVDKILVLSKKKGNSSQQMGTHGCKPLRKCVYVWRK